MTDVCNSRLVSVGDPAPTLANPVPVWTGTVAIQRRVVGRVAPTREGTVRS